MDTKFNNATVTVSGYCMTRLDILTENKYVVSEHFTDLFSINIFVTCQLHSLTMFLCFLC